MSCTLRHLNADSSWLIELPLDARAADGSTRPFTLLVDPWLHGDQIDFLAAFSKQWHGKSTPTFESIEALQAAGHPFDAVLISHEFTDHCHRDTLLQVDRDVPVFAATKEAVARLKSFKHFKRVIGLPYYSGKAPDRFLPSGTVAATTLAEEHGVDLPADFPAGMSFAYLPTKGALDFARLHGVVLIAFESAQLEAQAPTQALLYSPHGVPEGSLGDFVRQHGARLDVLALLHSLDYVYNPWWLGGPVALGHRSALPIARLLNPRLLVSTHDEDDKIAKGLVGVVLKRDKAPPVEEMERRLTSDCRTKLRFVPNGEQLLL